jgi:hypothetical protein
MMRSADALAQGRIIAEQRRGFYRIIQSWSTADLQASAIRYRMEALAPQNVNRFSFVLVRALRNMIGARAARKSRMRMVK